MSLPPLPLLVAGPPVPRGSDSYELKRAAHVQRLADSIPVELRLPQSVIDNAPRDVTTIPRECGLLTARELHITDDYDATALAEAIANKKLTAVEVATAYSKRAAIAHQLTGCLTEWFMDDALTRARELDDHLASTGRTVGPLHGVPTSIKAHMPVKGHKVDAGSITTLMDVDFDCHAVEVLRKAGAVFYCKTNQPQLVMHLECCSFHGRSLNPHNTGLTPGGSSGGEAALLAMHGSAFGIGSDIGGSIRAPAAFCGIYGFKPTSNVLPRKDGLIGGSAAELTIPACCGPMSRSLRDMDLFMSVYSAAQTWRVDPRLDPRPWTGLATPVTRQGPLKVGIMKHDGFIMPQPPVTRALEWARAQLTGARGIELREYKPHRAAEAFKNVRRAYWPDGGCGIRNALIESGEPWSNLSQWTIQASEDEPARTTECMFKMAVTKENFWFDAAEHWQSQDIDVLICPAFVGPACSHETGFFWTYTSYWNYLDMPGAVLPTPIVAGAKGTESYADSTPLSEECQQVRKFWEAGDFEGAPIALQVIAPRYHDNELFQALGQLKDHLDTKQQAGQL